MQVDEDTITQSTLLHSDIPGYDLPAIDFVSSYCDLYRILSKVPQDNAGYACSLYNQEYDWHTSIQS